jgi:hypothetical protein
MIVEIHSPMIIKTRRRRLLDTRKLCEASADVHGLEMHQVLSAIELDIASYYNLLHYLYLCVRGLKTGYLMERERRRETERDGERRRETEREGERGRERDLPKYV